MSSSNQSKFEASFANDANGAAFKDLMKKSNSNNSGSGNSTSNSNDDQKQQQQLIHQQQLNDIKFPSSNELEDSNNRQDPPPPEDLNLFINDLLEQMVSITVEGGDSVYDLERLSRLFESHCIYSRHTFSYIFL
mmetsp:Transcript_3458/g.4249  ORF Transcript_3458/g.4249 Transcript_3458/m.4249 type:complete len:134 (+) Transcript_3458:74-475(+)|eukprot:CAMPEP_0203663208 /NCGR_PEP_ID=MMETSP0090-20130426/881_1 /ASSEMBLY_ACC=CAM_ASM_001088 /TAXON_ID=426623 /ORGANISM="Chaetoceros affinis, Strain CCMP159" /LENGTH=133 /DNA_ID=CAMNT_0050526087 /DNA_START=54 /DNA_END=455 /DNA_ORIENTATION=-